VILSGKPDPRFNYCPSPGKPIDVKEQWGVVKDDNGREGIKVIARDQGPGIENLDLALQDGYTSGGGLGLGLPGARRLVDDFDIQTAPGQGTTVTLVMWARPNARAA